MPQTDSSIIRLAITAGEPAGIGPDIVIKLAARDLPYQLVVIADSVLLQQRAQQLNLPLELIPFNKTSPRQPHQAGKLYISNVSMAQQAEAGKLNPDNALYVLETLQVASAGCMDKTFDAMVTGPVHKGVINDAGIPFTGHTEYLAEQCGGDPVMVLAAKTLRVALATTHLPLSEVSAAITTSTLEKNLRILNADLKKYFALKNPHILVCGLNPHAGENGHLGREEIETIQPVIDSLNQQGFNLSGALPADTVFTEKYLKTADAVFAMYHDQGLPVLKHIGFGNAVNITFGLPIIRTSVDHGTALDLAGTGKADTGSLEFACTNAVLMAKNDKKD